MSGESSTKPLVVALCAVPLLKEVLVSALADRAEVQTFPAQGGDTVGLLRWLKPEMQSSSTPTRLKRWPRSATSRIHLYYTSRYKTEGLRLLRNGEWEEAGTGDTSSEDIRNIVAAGLSGRGRGHEHG
jgi:hypothetical protein